MSSKAKGVLSEIMSEVNYYPVSVFNVCSARYHYSVSFKNKVYMELDLKDHEKADEIQREKLLVESALVGDYDAMSSLLSSGVSVDAEEFNKALFYASRNYMTPLQIAAARGHWGCVQLLIEYNADVDAKDRFDVTAMHIAAQEGHYFCLKALLDAGADCNSSTKYSRKGYYTAVPYLGGTTPLHLAAANNRVNCTKELILYGADYNAVDEYGRTGLYIASQAGYEACVLAQLKNAVGRDILSLPGFDTGDTPLHFAVHRGMVDCVKELLHLGSDVNHLNYSGNSPLHVAVNAGCPEPDVAIEILKLLVLNSYSCDVNLTDSVELTPLHYVCFNAGAMLMRRPEMAKFLIAYGANVNITNHRGVSLLEYEYNSTNDASILNAIVQSLNIPPPVSQLRDLHHNSPFPLLIPNSVAPIYAMWVALRRGIPPPTSYENFHVQQMGATLHHSLKKKHDWYQSIVSTSRPLAHYCRYSIRTAMGYKRLRHIKDLPIPHALKSYLLLESEDPGL